MNKELKPCPFCGGEAETWVEFESYFDAGGCDEINICHCGCKSCGISVSIPWDEERAIWLWNRRTTDE